MFSRLMTCWYYVGNTSLLLTQGTHTELVTSLYTTTGSGRKFELASVPCRFKEKLS